MVKNLPAMQETQVQCLDWDDSPGKGNGNSIQYSCLENSMDRGAWWATVHGLQRVRHHSLSLFLVKSKHLNFMAAVTICSDFEAQENKICHISSSSICHGIMKDAMIFVSECWVLRQLFHSPLSPTSRDFLPLGWYHLHIWGYWHFSRQSWFQPVSHLAWHFTWCTLHIS